PSSKNQKYDLTDIVRNPSITEISQIVPNTESITMQYGDVYNISVSTQPNSTNDVVLWKSADDSVATVSRGIVQGNKIGTTVITAFSQSGSASTEIKVTVLPRQTDIPAESITLDSAGYEVLKGKYVNIDAAIEPVNSTDSLIYSSSNEEVATVNRQGKIVGVSAGTAYITVMASSGITETVPVTVTEASGENKLSLAANVYYNDPGYNGNETGEPITVTGDGQYTLSFDVNSDLSDRAKDAGIEFLKNLTSIYIKDNDVTMGSAVRSPLDGCLIRYDSVKVNGTPLTLINSEFKSAIKDSGIFDTNDPINGWDGSAVEEVTTSDHTVNFTTVEDPAKIEITFTLKDLKFSEEVSAGDIPAEAIVPEAGVDITLTEGQELNLGVKLTPDNTTSLVSFTSSDMGVVMVDDSAAAVDENGCAYACLKGVSSGSAVITAMTDNGLKAVLNVTVGVYPFSSVVPVVENGVLSSVTAVAEYIPSGEFAVIAAVYDSGGAVKACESMQLDASAVSNGILNADGFSLNVGEGDTVKAFIWSSTGDMIPMSK
ncbi:MAG TPA: Ig-like domain-containing protein, partial [Candidatus Monoglobus merdigallinarum]|nr:Ig-like domain-containing protein [Candidatus Monoglobus merdigallinarum]